MLKRPLAVIPRQDLDRPDVLFLKGRLAWQNVQVGNTLYSLDDSRRFWQAAAQQDPDSPLYALALGFVFYAEDNLTAAMNQFQGGRSPAWRETIPPMRNLSGA